MSRTEPPIVGLIGGVASGKSTVARYLQDRGALWLDSDAMAHQVLNTPEVLALLHEKFGANILRADGQADRHRIAGLVFGDGEQASANLMWLQSIIHPRVRRMTEDRIVAAGEEYPMIVIDAPLLLEAGWGPRCQRILFVDTPPELRQKLATQRGWASDEIARRESAQMTLDEKRAKATDVIRNDGSLADLESQVEQFVRSLQSPST